MIKSITVSNKEQEERQWLKSLPDDLGREIGAYLGLSDPRRINQNPDIEEPTPLHYFKNCQN